MKEDPIIARLVPDPAALPDLQRLTGYLGRSVRPDSWRLYQTPSLNDYLEIAQQDIVRSESPESQGDAPGVTVVWIKKGANVQHVRSESWQAQSEFLGGDIADHFLSDTGGLETQTTTALAMKNTNKCLTWGCCRVRRFSEEMSDARTGFLEGDIVGLFLTEALATEEGTVMKYRGSHRCLTWGCCRPGPITRSPA